MQLAAPELIGLFNTSLLPLAEAASAAAVLCTGADCTADARWATQHVEQHHGMQDDLRMGVWCLCDMVHRCNASRYRQRSQNLANPPTRPVCSLHKVPSWAPW